MNTFFNLFFLLAASVSIESHSTTNKIFKSEKHSFQIEELTKQNGAIIWGFDFINEDEIIFTEREGKLKIFKPSTKLITEISGLPQIYTEGQGGLLDVRVHPTNKKQIFFTYSEPTENKKSTTALATAIISGDKLTEFKKLFSAIEATDETIHFGSRIEFDYKDHMWVSIGDRNERSNVQNLNFHNGKIIRLKLDGSVPQDNPFVNVKNARPEIWSSGHRSPQGLVYDAKTNSLWETEMGPRGGDELNLIEKTNNYGWPDVTYGREYWGPKIGVTEKLGTTQPIAHWVPSISPSGMTIYNHDAFSNWKNNIFIGTLSSSHLRRLVIENQKVTHQEILLKDLNKRIRCVRTGPDGAIYLSTDSGDLLRLKPN